MMRHWLMGAAAFAMMTGVAYAESATSDSSTSTQTTTTAKPLRGGSIKNETRQSTDSDGTATDTSKTYRSGATGWEATSKSRTTSPDGSVKSASHEKTTASPDGDSTITKKSTKTTTDR